MQCSIADVQESTELPDTKTVDGQMIFKSCSANSQVTQLELKAELDEIPRDSSFAKGKPV